MWAEGGGSVFLFVQIFFVLKDKQRFYENIIVYALDLKFVRVRFL